MIKENYNPGLLTSDPQIINHVLFQDNFYSNQVFTIRLDQVFLLLLQLTLYSNGEIQLPHSCVCKRGCWQNPAHCVIETMKWVKTNKGVFHMNQPGMKSWPFCTSCANLGRLSLPKSIK